MNNSELPLVEGGQGHTAEEVQATGDSMIILIIGALVAGLLGICVAACCL